ncbi:universal stress protein [Planctomicrobium piriforme]|uniref:Nucleotide-binding universal stress protein, UspA family n=1 Tax=Planctomicrobium piriforme TaxID=1576369 RepID=A0A1I3TDD7_9PLAN|nr:universal stress protein [Planctomicrobium piriforme]SFJ67507.1 Nucleotide-binding universal stress protein, UspA family [Planctomicrobium piriforme]
MIRLAKILVPTDFSEFSKHALKYGCELARKFSAELTVLNVVEDIYPLVADPGLMLSAPVDMTTELQQASEIGLKTFVPADWAEGITIHHKVLVGTPFVEVVRFAREHQFDLLVITTHGRSGLAHALMGSVAEKIVRKSSCPVLTVRPEGHDFVMP